MLNWFLYGALCVQICELYNILHIRVEMTEAVR